MFAQHSELGPIVNRRVRLGPVYFPGLPRDPTDDSHHKHKQCQYDVAQPIPRLFLGQCFNHAMGGLSWCCSRRNASDSICPQIAFDQGFQWLNTMSKSSTLTIWS